MKVLFSLFLLLSFSVHAQVVLSEKSDERFGGYYVDVDKTLVSLNSAWRHKIFISDVLMLQKQLRECLVNKSKSFFRQKQTPFLNACLEKVNDLGHFLVTREHVYDSKGLTVVFDMDETLLTQWSKVSKEHPEKTTFVVKNRDHTLSEKDGLITMAPHGVTIRPGSLEVLNKLTYNPRVERIFFFSAREDKSAAELRDYFLRRLPFLKRKFVKLYGRNSLRLDSATNTPSKDLRIISPGLKNVILVDDNPGRVMQKDHNFTIPKFNADLYIEGIEKGDVHVVHANQVAMEFVSGLLEKMSYSSHVELDFYFFSTKRAEEASIDWGREILIWSGFSEAEIKRLMDLKVYVQDYYTGETIKQ